MKILLTGGTGLIGRHLIPRLLELGHSVTVSTRHPDTARARLDPRVTLWRDFEAITTSMILMPSSIWRVNPSLINAGRPSRNNACQPLGSHAAAGGPDPRQRHPPSVLISGSAIGYYGDLGEVVVTEEEPPHNEFTHSYAPAGNKLPAKRKASAPASACCAPAWYWLRGRYSRQNDTRL